MHRTLVTIAGALAIIAVSGQAVEPPAVPACPKEISATQTVNGIPSGWAEAKLTDRFPFVTVRFSEGDPADQVFLAPSRTRERGKFLTSAWDFGRSEYGYWLTCGYANTGLGLTRKLPGDIASCDAEFDASFAVPVAIRVTCSTK